MKERRRRRRRICWTRPWILRRPQFGLYDQLMVELRREDEAAFINFMRMPPEMFEEVLYHVYRIAPRIIKQRTSHARRTVKESRWLYMDEGQVAEGRRGRL